MPDKETLERAEEDKREGKSPSTQAGEFVREEIEHVREGKHGARSTRQAIAIGLSKARRAGVQLPAPKKGKASSETRRKASRDVRRGKSRRSPRRPAPAPRARRCAARGTARVHESALAPGAYLRVPPLGGLALARGEEGRGDALEEIGDQPERGRDTSRRVLGTALAMRCRPGGST